MPFITHRKAENYILVEIKMRLKRTFTKNNVWSFIEQTLSWTNQDNNNFYRKLHGDHTSYYQLYRILSKSGLIDPHCPMFQNGSSFEMFHFSPYSFKFVSKRSPWLTLALIFSISKQTQKKQTKYLNNQSLPSFAAIKIPGISLNNLNSKSNIFLHNVGLSA